jgi:hypothetical protein
MTPEEVEALPAVRLDINTLPRVFTLTVTENHISRAVAERASHLRPQSCPIAQAFRDATGVAPESHRFGVLSNRIRVGDWGKDDSWWNEENAQEFIYAFDSDQITIARRLAGTFRFTRGSDR